MKKTKVLIGNKIVDSKTGNILGKVKDIIFSPYMNIIIGFCIDCSNWCTKTKLIKVKDILIIKNNIIYIKDKHELISIKKDQELIKILNINRKIYKLKVCNLKGQDLGYIDDIIFDDKNFKIYGYILTNGFIEDFINGKIIISSNDEIIFGENNIVINDNGYNVKFKIEFSLINTLNSKKRNGTNEI